jgi:ribosomal protein L19
LVASSNIYVLSEIGNEKCCLGKEDEVWLWHRRISFFLGLQICQRNQGIFISQTKYIREMLKRFGMEDCKPVNTPMQTSCKLSKDDDSKSTDQRQYMSMIGSLLYVTTSIF